ncbi:type VII secretion target [Nocardia alni]|uniref:type VII secretion target n=1 Tax=Nocardia alni TaxID=2815723 RepID=UPI001C21D868|nr:type VII secretion target [Nocardia alni]
MAENLNVDPAVLTQAADGINGIIGELSGLGTGETGAVGRGLSLLRLSGMQAGKASVHKALSTFLDRWSWGVRALVQAGNEMAESLHLAAGRYHEMDETFSNMLKEGYADLVGNPHLSNDQIDARSWGDTLADNGFNDMRHPDYSQSSLQGALDHVKKDGQAIAAIAPATIGQPLRWNTGAAQRAAQIMNENGGN